MHARAQSLPPLVGSDLEAAFVHLASQHPNVFWLDAGAHARSGWSFLGFGDPGSEAEIFATRVEGGPSASTWSAGPFQGGWVGWAGYDSAAERAGAPVGPERDSTPSSAWIQATSWIALDHATGETWAVGGSADDSHTWAAEAGDLLNATVDAVSSLAKKRVTAAERHSAEHYANLIHECRDAIRAGDAYQLCLTTRFTVSGTHDPVTAYRRLRASSRTGRGCFVRTRTDDGGSVALCSATPEQFLRADAGVIRTRPIKGTRPRGTDAESDSRLAQELAESEKERAENVMIVDLMRNDLSRVCEPGTVRVDELLAIESYPHVHQLVSTVSGELRPNVTVGELLHRTFPAGSMTGAPKLSAMTILHRLEAGPRGAYAGCVGWIGAAGNLDLAMTIRTIVVTPTEASVGAGGGITWSSDAAEEVREVGIKASAPLAALGAHLPAGW